ncbi:MAG TPA: protein kinase [Pseudomonadota bacterium]|nr:protein kinase [Pseudomonadota bacterium]
MSEQPESGTQTEPASSLVRRAPRGGDVLDTIYRLDAPLGKGGVGVVFRAWHLHLQRPCAIKFLHPQLVSNPELRTRFRREAQSAFQLGHPNIVSITDFRDDGTTWPYLVMELVKGQSLRERLEKGPLDPQLAVRLMAEVADALVAAHRRGVIHRDLKPENLLLGVVENPAPGEPALTAKVLDFGLSKMLDGVEITGTGRLVGSPSYMSPEQARGDSYLVDARSDIWTVGVLLYECLTAEKLFPCEDFEQKRQMIMEAKLPPLPFVERGLPILIEKIIARCCQRLPEHRYQTATSLLHALNAVYPRPQPRIETLPPGTKLQGGVLVLGQGPTQTDIHAAKNDVLARNAVTAPFPSQPSAPEIVIVPALVQSMSQDALTTGVMKSTAPFVEQGAAGSSRKKQLLVTAGAVSVAMCFVGFAGYTLWQSQRPPTQPTQPTQPTIDTPKQDPLTASTRSTGQEKGGLLPAPQKDSVPKEAVPIKPNPPTENGLDLAPAEQAIVAPTAAEKPIPENENLETQKRPHTVPTLALRGPYAKPVGTPPTHPLRFGPPRHLLSTGMELPAPVMKVPFATEPTDATDSATATGGASAKKTELTDSKNTPNAKEAAGKETPARKDAASKEAPEATPNKEQVKEQASAAKEIPAKDTAPSKEVASAKEVASGKETMMKDTPASKDTGGSVAQPQLAKAELAKREKTSRVAGTDGKAEPVTTQEAAVAANAILRKATGQVGRCYPAGAVLPSKISVELTVAKTGKITDVSAEGAGDQIGCVKNAIKTLRLGSINDADSYNLQYDFVNLHR